MAVEWVRENQAFLPLLQPVNWENDNWIESVVLLFKITWALVVTTPDFYPFLATQYSGAHCSAGYRPAVWHLEVGSDLNSPRAWQVGSRWARTAH